jgi:transcriptional regulator NrdR family protein
MYFPCPECGSRNSVVVSTVNTADTEIVRRRRCRACDHRWYTVQQAEQFLHPDRIRWMPNGARSYRNGIKLVEVGT